MTNFQFYYLFSLIGFTVLLGIFLIWKHKANKGHQFINQDIRWCQDVLRISENALNWISKLNRPLSKSELDSLVQLGYEYDRMSKITGIVSKRNKEINNEKENIEKSKES